MTGKCIFNGSTLSWSLAKTHHIIGQLTWFSFNHKAWSSWRINLNKNFGFTSQMLNACVYKHDY